MGSCFTYFQHPFSRRRVFVDPKLREFFATVLQPETLAIHGNVAGRLRPTGAWGRHPAEIFSICVRMARVSRPAQSVDSPGRLSVVRRIGRHSAIGPDIESLRSERTTNKTSHSSDAQQRRWSLFEFRDLSHKRPTTTSLLPSRTHLRRYARAGPPPYDCVS